MGWYVTRYGDTVGPVSEAQLAEWIRGGMTAGAVREETSHAWLQLSEFGRLFLEANPPVRRGGARGLLGWALLAVGVALCSLLVALAIVWGTPIEYEARSEASTPLYLHEAGEEEEQKVPAERLARRVPPDTLLRVLISSSPRSRVRVVGASRLAGREGWVDNASLGSVRRIQADPAWTAIQLFAGLFPLAVVAAMGLRRAAKRQRASRLEFLRSRARQLEAEELRRRAAIRRLTSPHQRTLWQKRKELVRENDYGNENVDGWYAEVQRFAEFVILPGAAVGELQPPPTLDLVADVVGEVVDEFETAQDACRLQAQLRLRTLAEKHAAVLARKRRQHVHIDEYGKEVRENWYGEVARFVTQVVMPELTDDQADALGAVPLLVVQTVEDVVSACGGMVGDPTYRPEMTGQEYEVLVEAIIVRNGWQVSRTPTTGDQGVDLIAGDGDARVALQCKRSQSPVGNKAVQQVVAGAKHYGCRTAVVVSDASITPSAQELARTNNVTLVHHDEVETFLRSAHTNAAR